MTDRNTMTILNLSFYLVFTADDLPYISITHHLNSLSSCIYSLSLRFYEYLYLHLSLRKKIEIE